MEIHAYLTFDGQAEEACRFYATALGAEMTEVHRFGSMPTGDGPELTEEQKNRVMHVGLNLAKGQMLMASDTLEGMSPPHVAGNNVSISFHPSSREQADSVFGALAEGGTVTMPLADQFWGDYFGSLTDRFGIHWMVNFSEMGTQP